MTLSDRLYLRLPVELQNLACTIEGGRIRNWRYGARFQKILDDYEKRNAISQEELEGFRDERLRWFLNFAHTHVPYYQRYFAGVKLRPEDINKLSDLANLPRMTKSEARGAPLRAPKRALAGSRVMEARTSGTTGASFVFPVTQEAVQHQWAVWWRYRRWYGIPMNALCAYFGGRTIVPVRQERPPYWRYNWRAHQILFSAHHMSPDRLSAYVEELRNRKAPWIHGYPSMVSLLASYVLERRVDLGYQVKWVTTGSENLTDQQRATIQKAFSAQPHQNYGMAEGVANFSECESGVLHVDEDYSAVEFVPTGDGVTHWVVGTNFTNMAAPLIRYDLHDMVTLCRGPCSCGRPGRTVQHIDGRTEDYVLLRDGRRFGPANHLFKLVPKVREGQLVQGGPGKIRVRVVRADGYGGAEERVLYEEIERRLGSVSDVEVEYTDSLERSPSGKLRAVVHNAQSDAVGARAAQASEEGLIKRYSQLPILLQHAACSLQGRRIQNRRYGSGYGQLQREVNERAMWSPEQVAAFRDGRIAGFVRHAAKTCEWYRQQMRRLGIAPEEIRGLSDLAWLPIITKSDVQAQPNAFASNMYHNQKTLMVHTSGTTGGALRFLVSERAEREQWAIWWRYRASHGITRETWCGYFGGRSIVPAWQKSPPYWRYNWSARQIMFSAYHMGSQNLSAYLAKLRESRPPWIHGYPSVLALLASFMLERQSDLGYQVRWVTVGAESLLPHQADAIERAFGVRPRQHYGMSEAVANFSECECGRLHVDGDFAGVEFVPVVDGKTYRVVGTNFSNPATPLIRYDTQDLVQLAEGICPCGRPGRLVEQIDGRREDYVVLRGGARVGRMDHIFKDMIHIREAQIYQRVPDAIVIRVVRGAGYTDADEQSLLNAVRLRLGGEVSVSVEYHDKLARSASGKLRFVVSEIESGKIEATQCR